MAAPAPTVADHAAPRSSPPEPIAATPENPIVAESRSFASALALWHRDHDAAAALAALDAHDRRFPAGQIQLEARVLRAEILLAGNRDHEALALLDQLALAGLPRARELRTVRGELRIQAGRCADGKADLQAVLANGDLDGFAQRARRAIAACR
jgi:outer membrane PBP1 activator LpoA protein